MELAYLPIDAMKIIARHTSPYIAVSRCCAGDCSWSDVDGVKKPCGCKRVKFVPYISDFLKLTATCKEMAELRRDIIHPTILLYYKHGISGCIRRAKESAVETSITKCVPADGVHEPFYYLEESKRPSATVEIEATCDKNNKLWQAQFPPVVVSAFDEQRFLACMRCYSGLGV